MRERGREKNKPFVQIDIGFLAHQIRVSTAHALDLGEGVHDLLLAVDVGVEETEDELEVRLLARDERCYEKPILV